MDNFSSAGCNNINMTDRELTRLILQGDKEKFRILVEKYQGLIFRTCMGFLHNSEDADDLTQEVFIQVYQSLIYFKGNAAFSTWIYRIAVNACLNKIRKNRKNTALQRFSTLFSNIKNSDFLIPVSDMINPESILIRQEYKDWLQAALDSLPDNQKTAIILSKYDDLSQKEIAEILNTTEGAVEALIQRAKKNLYKRLSGQRKFYK